MIKLEIENKNEYEYNLKDENNNYYTFCLEFLDMDEIPQIGDYIYINDELLNPKYEGFSTSYAFGNLENKYGKENILLDDIDVIKVVKNDMEIVLKRLYG